MKCQAVEQTHLASLEALFSKALPLDHVCGKLLREKIWHDPDFKAEWALVATQDREVMGFGMAVLRPNNIGYLKCLAIAPPFQRRGFGGQLLTRLEHNLESAGATAIRLAESAPNYLWPGVDIRYRKATSFFEQNGYQPRGSTQNLSVDLKTGPFQTKPEEGQLANKNFYFRRARPSDRLSCLLFLERTWPSWKLEVGHAFVNQPISLHLALREEKIAAFAAYDTNNLQHGWFGPMGTESEFRGLGLGSILLKRCLNDLADQGSTRAVIPWVGPARFYRHHVGALPAQSFIRYEKPL